MTQGTPQVGDDVDWNDVPSGALVWPVADTHFELDRAWLRLGGRVHKVHGSLGWSGRLGPTCLAGAPALSMAAVAPRSADQRWLTKVTIVALGLTGRETSADLDKLAVDFERGRILAHLKSAVCISCGAPAACWGTSEGQKFVDPMCDECCGHGNEDGWCSMSCDEHMTSLAAKLAAAGYRLTDDSERMYKLLYPETDE